MSTKHLVNIGQTAWDKIEGYGESLGGTTQEFAESHGNMMRTDWEQGRKKAKKELQKEKTRPIMSACRAFSLTA